jgi:hypothetical protein
MRLAAFIVSLLLLAGSVEPVQGWLITLVVLTGLAAFRVHVFWPFSWRPALDVRMAAFVLAVLLLAGTIDATRGWLIVTTIATGVAMTCPGLLSIDDGGPRPWRWRARRHRIAWHGERFR